MGKKVVLVVTTPEVSAIRDADRIIGLLEASEIKDISLIVNKIRVNMVKRGDMMSVEDVIDILAIDLLGIVLDDENIVVASNEGEPLVGSYSKAGTAYMNICARVLGEDIPLLDLEREPIFYRVRRLLKKEY